MNVNHAITYTIFKTSYYMLYTKKSKYCISNMPFNVSNNVYHIIYIDYKIHYITIQILYHKY